MTLDEALAAVPGELKPLIIGRVVTVATEKRFIYIEEIGDGTMRLTISKAMLERE